MSIVMAEDSVPFTSEHISAFVLSLLRNKNFSQVLEWYKRLSADSSGQFPKPNQIVFEAAFEAALLLGNDKLAAEIFPLVVGESPNTLALCKFGSKSLANKNFDSAIQVLTALQNNSNLAEPPSFLFLVELLRISVENSLFNDCRASIFQYVEKKLGGRNAAFELFLAVLSRDINLSDALKFYKSFSPNLDEAESIHSKFIELFLAWTKNSQNQSELTIDDYEILFECAGANIVIFSILQDLQTRGLQATEKISTAVLTKLRSLAANDLVENWIKKMRQAGVITGPRVMGEAMSEEEVLAYSENIVFETSYNNVERAISLVNELFSLSKKPTFTAIVKLTKKLFEEDRFDDGMQILERYRKFAKVRYQRVVVHDLLIYGWATAGNLPQACAEARIIMEEYKEMPFNFRALTSKLAYLFTENDVFLKKSSGHRSITADKDNKRQLVPVTPEEASSIVLKGLEFISPGKFPELAAKGYIADTWRDILSILAKVGHAEAAYNLYTEMKLTNTFQNKFAITYLLDSMAKSMDAKYSLEILDEAMELYKVDKSWFDTVIMMQLKRFNNIISATSIFNLAICKGITVGESSYRALINAYLEKSNYKMVVHMIVKMFQAGINVPATYLEALFKPDILENLSREDFKNFIQVICEKLKQTNISNAFVEKAFHANLNLRSQLSNENLASLSADFLIKSPTFVPSKTISGNELMIYLESRRYLDSVFTILERMPSFSSKLVNSRNLESVSIAIFGAAQASNQQLLNRGMKLLKADGFSDEDVLEVQNCVDEISQVRMDGEVGSAASAVSKAHIFAQAAEDYTERGSVALAVEAHFRAAEQFLLATSFTADPEAARTLRMLYASHTRQGKDLQRRMAKSAATAVVSASSGTNTSSMTTETAAETPSSATPQLLSHPQLQHRPLLPRPIVSSPAAKSGVTTNQLADDIRLHKQQQLAKHQFSMWNNELPLKSAGNNIVSNSSNMDGSDDISVYESRHFFGAGHITSSDSVDASSLFIPPALSDASAKNSSPLGRKGVAGIPNESNYAGIFSPTRQPANSNEVPATMPVESLDISVANLGPADSRRTSHQQNRQFIPSDRNNSSMSDIIDRSYYILEETQTNQIPKINDDQPEDPFNKFWDVVENLVQKISIGPFHAIQQQNFIPQWSPSAAPMPLDPTGSANIKGVAIPGRPGYTPTAPVPIKPQMFENLKGFKNTSSSSKALSSTLSDQQSLMASTSNNMLNSYFVVPSANQSVGASYLGGTGGMGYDPNRQYPEGVEVKLGGANTDSEVPIAPVTSIRAGGGGMALPRKMRSVGGGSEGRNVLGIRAKTHEELLHENEQLKSTIEFLTKRVQFLEKAGEENQMLKSSIIQFRQDVQRQAKRYGVPGATGGNNPSASISGNILSPRYTSENAGIQQYNQQHQKNGSPGASGIGGDTKDQISNDGQIAIRRVASLEKELLETKENYEKQLTDLLKYKERWLKVKDSSRKKKEAKSFVGNAEDDASPINTRISTPNGGVGVAEGSLDASLTSSISSAYIFNRNTPNLTNEDIAVGTPSPVRKPFSMPPVSSMLMETPFSAPMPPVETAKNQHSNTQVSAMYSSQLKTPVASTMGFPQTPTLPATASFAQTPQPLHSNLAGSIVMDSSAALLSLHLQDPSLLETPTKQSVGNSQRENQNSAQKSLYGRQIGDGITESVASSSGLFYSVQNFNP
ncbi:hypothetical protein HK100_005006 [Physocladia obscura]|uniref:Uncharacterized protein n=1 Tax=Physocladia obscura TaxID=109957 RepID=A0AAD5XCM1_9FUNG|nr:hypothetical protein HK100_005006 [Physocladia obscura]